MHVSNINLQKFASVRGKWNKERPDVIQCVMEKANYVAEPFHIFLIQIFTFNQKIYLEVFQNSYLTLKNPWISPHST